MAGFHPLTASAEGPGDGRDDLARYSRQVVLPQIGNAGQRALLRSRVLVLGCGALGTHIAELAIRAGIGEVRLVDRDVVELTNLQRQVLFDEGDVEARLPKAVAAARKLSRINSAALVEPKVLDVTGRNLEALLDGVAVVLDGTDGFETRYLVNDACVKHGIPWVYAGVIGTSGMTLTVVPGRGPCLRCVLPDPPEPGSFPTCDTAGVLNTAPALMAALQVTEAVKLLLGREETHHALISFDMWSREIDSVRLERDPDCPACGHRRFEFLEAEDGAWTSPLCGRNAVQITPRRGTSLPLDDLALRLAAVGEVVFNGFILQLAVEGLTMLLFPDGRVVVQGTSDEAVARGVYARYVGS